MIDASGGIHFTSCFSFGDCERAIPLLSFTLSAISSLLDPFVSPACSFITFSFLCVFEKHIHLFACCVVHHWPCCFLSLTTPLLPPLLLPQGFVDVSPMLS